MRIAFVLVCLTVIATVAGVGVRAIGSAHEMSLKQQRELDSAIDRIVAEHNERREAGLTTGSAPKPEAAAGAAISEGKDKRFETADRYEPKVVTVASQPKSQRPRAGRTASRSNVLIPQAFVSLPKFATTTLFGLR